MDKNEISGSIIRGMIPLLCISFIAIASKIKFFKVKSYSDDSIPLLSEKEFQRIMLYSVGVIIVSMMVIGVFNYVLLLILAKIYFFIFFSQNEFLKIPSVSYGIPSIFLGIALSYYPYEFWLRNFYRDKFNSFNKTYDLKYGIDNIKLSKFLVVIISTLSFLAFFYEISCTSYIEKKQIIINRIGSFKSQKYDLHDVSKIVHSRHLNFPNGSIISRSNFTIIFSDNFQWNFDEEEANLNFVHVVSEKSRRPIEEIY